MRRIQDPVPDEMPVPHDEKLSVHGELLGGEISAISGSFPRKKSM